MSVFTKINTMINKGPIRVLSLLLALIVAGLVIWDPTQFAAKTSEFAIWQSFIMIWAVCSAIIFGVGFSPNNRYWQIVFYPPPAILILILIVMYIVTR